MELETQNFFFHFLLNRKQFVQIGDTKSTTNEMNRALGHLCAHIG